MRHKPARGFRMAAFSLVLAVAASLTAPVAHAAADPAPAPRVSSQKYPPSQPGGGVGVAGAFELDADYDVLKYVYSFTNDAGFLDWTSRGALGVGRHAGRRRREQRPDVARRPGPGLGRVHGQGRRAG
ncbi:hypothetical protein [Lentzea sp. NPDC003310]|uniref:hypothetical protein n=1 Tax=Lentzea sp. NPDC003310 TaxID=3154447 RepID=UPI0033BC0A99